MLREGSIVDATIFSAPSSTKNSSGKRDPEMHQTRKGNEWRFGIKMHIGVYDTRGLIHSLDTAAANVHDIVLSDKLKAEKIKASARAKVEHPLPVHRAGLRLQQSPLLRLGAAKNNNRLHLLAAFSNLLNGEKYMLAQGQCACFPPKWQEKGKKTDK
jgi:IS5 family transposase